MRDVLRTFYARCIPRRVSAPDGVPSTGEAVAPLPALNDGVRRRPVRRRPVRLLALSTATRDYARRLEAGLLDGARDDDLRPLAEAMAPEIWAWEYALRLTGQTAWRARPGIEERIERAIAHRLMVADLDTWDRAVRILDARMDRAKVGELPMPPPLALPEEVRLGLEARRKAALERLGRRRGRPTDTSGGPAPVPEEAAHHPPLPSRPV